MCFWEPAQKQALEKLCAKTGAPVAELIRRAINAYLKRGRGELAMLTIYRRHEKSCEHRASGRRYRRCQCVIWVDGFIGNREIRQLVSFAIGLRLRTCA